MSSLFPDYQAFQLLALELQHRLDSSFILLNKEYDPEPCCEANSRRYFGFTKLFFEESSDWVWSLLARPSGGAAEGPSILTESTRLSALERLPNELVDIIFDELSMDKRHAVGLALCSKYLWNLLIRRIRSQYLRSAAPWAGKKVLVLGSQTSHLPPAFAELETYNTLKLRNVKSPPSANHRSFRLFEELIQLDFSVPPIMHAQEAEWKKAIGLHLPRKPRNWLPDYSEIYEFGHLSIFCLFPQDRTWILRNLTVHKFVSSNYLTTHNLRYAGLHPYFTFHHILLSRICWSSIPDSIDRALSYNNANIHHGIWAGHSFDIVTQEEHDETCGQEYWENASEEALAHVVHIWRMATDHLPYFRRRYGRIKNRISSSSKTVESED
ncbi:uncharacterized protein BDR25DRAFT_302720 [Lindgomyces ingoldianus]|uniref:Uncharacterized protein n=1 Tax=Lindgomyces ingoldianus TaxID=673940 RepID=A0ACB6R0H2_9PLEO|nr:uncharacterized protein BDR25DRAFT_302720 [Lindgomyces ingoldianus]KAF2472590.1 hypothetical protein BDR25DRAFT_302720 [Lindgomyces ingoldianus]